MCKIGRTHLQDAVPMTLGQEFSGYASALEIDVRGIERALEVRAYVRGLLTERGVILGRIEFTDTSSSLLPTQRNQNNDRSCTPSRRGAPP